MVSEADQALFFVLAALRTKKKTPAFLHGVFRRGENAPLRLNFPRLPIHPISTQIPVKSGSPAEEVDNCLRESAKSRASLQ